jgi:pSer/pThr/pTyr-binding forkhead associated (FHA) protein
MRPLPPNKILNIQVANKGNKTEHFSFELVGNRFTIGRTIDNDFIIVDPAISRQHLAIILAKNNLNITDLGSRFGTLINGERIVRLTSISDSDIVRIGNTELKIGFEITQSGTVIIIPQEIKIKIYKKLPEKQIIFTASDNVAKLIFDFFDFYGAFKTNIYNSLPKNLFVRNKNDKNKLKLIKHIKHSINKTNMCDLNKTIYLTDVKLDYLFEYTIYPIINSGKINLFDIKNNEYVDYFKIINYGSKKTRSYSLPTGEIFFTYYESISFEMATRSCEAKAETFDFGDIRDF